MGCGQSSTPTEKRLNDELTKEKRVEIHVKKLLFLGSGGSGKSTLFKQLKQIHGDQWTREDRMTFVGRIHAQIIDQMNLALDCAEDEYEAQYDGDDEPEDDAFSKLSQTVQNAVDTLRDVEYPRLNEAVAEACKILWKEPIIKAIYENRAITTVQDSSAYFWDRIDDVMTAGFVPNDDDIILVRYRTTGVKEQRFTIKNTTFHIFDVGGQKSERKKWIHCFESVTAVIFVVSLSCYDEVMFEDEGVNSMVDSLELFGSICNDQWFRKTSMILFLNKKDLFAKKLAQNKAITLCPEFKSYKENASSFEDTTTYIKDAFFRRNKTPDDKSIFTHLTCATDKGNVEKVFNDVQHIIIENALANADLLE